MHFKRLLFLLLLFTGLKAYTQDVDFHLNSYLLTGKNILKVKRDFHDPYLWVLAQNNEVYRINSITLAVDDYTSRFAAYSNMQFIDIAGRSSDTVFIATNSTNVIEYKKGTLKVIGAADGIAGTINSIGVDYTGMYITDNNLGLPNRHTGNTLLIGTNKGICHYDYQAETLNSISSNLPERVFEATYRTELFSDQSLGTYSGTIKQHPAIALPGTGTILGGTLWYEGGYGNNIYTAYCTDGVVIDNFRAYDPSTFMNFYWGTENGLFQNNRANSSNTSSAHRHYLDGVKINKISSIYGLKVFGTSQYAGIIKENLLVGTNQGLYYSNSGYWQPAAAALPNYTFFHYDGLDNKKINDICVNATSYTTPICEDGVWVAVDDGLYLLKPDYAKYINSTSLNCIQFKNQPADTEAQICSGNSIIATVIPSAYSGHSIQWYKDGLELSAESAAEITISQSGDYTAVVYDPCSADIHVNSNHLKVTVVSDPVFSFNYPDKNTFCDGATATFKVDQNPNYKYRWYKDGVLNGNTSNTLNVTQSGKYKVEVSSCSNTWIPSKEIEAEFVKLPVPTLSADKASYCQGEEAMLAVNLPADASYTINWLRDGAVLNGSTNQTTLTTSVAGNYAVSISSNKITCSQSSLPVPVVFNPLPAINLEKIVNTTLCSGQVVDLNATFSGGTIRWSTGETSSRISVKDAGTYTATVTSASGCTDSQSIDVDFYNNPVLALKDATLCQFTQQQITLNAPSGFSKYVWNGVPGGKSYTTGSLGTVQLTVTDQNGCTASQTINITSYCSDIKMANTFTPNGDGVNDTWTIAGIDNSTTVKVYNRFGTLVFNNTGYTQPWDGTYKGTKLPAATYYYIVFAKAGTQVLSGWVTIIY